MKIIKVLHTKWLLAGLWGTLALSLAAKAENPPCIQVQMSSAPLGTKCDSQNRTFENVNRENFGMAVRDSNGLIWSNVIGDQPKTQPQANEICKTLGARLPSSDELFKGENKGGFFDVLPNIKIPVWSSTLGPGINEAYYYGGDHYIYFADITAPQIFVRCVAIASKKTR